MDVAHGVGGRSTLGLQPVLQQEESHQVARGVREEEPCDRRGLGLVRRRAGCAVACPQLDDGVGRGVVLDPGALPDLGQQAAAHEGSDGRPRQGARAESGLMRRWAFGEYRSRGTAQFRGARDQAVDQPESLGLVGPHGAAGQHQVQCGGGPQQAHGAHCAAEARVDSQLDLGQAQCEALVAHGDPVATGQRELESATEREALDGGDGGAGQRFQAVQYALRGAHEIEGLLRAVQRGELADVGACDEAAGLAGTQHEATRRGGGETGQESIQFEQHVAGEHVRRAFPAVERQPGDVSGVALQGPVGCVHARLLAPVGGTQAAVR